MANVTVYLAMLMLGSNFSSTALPNEEPKVAVASVATSAPVPATPMPASTVTTAPANAVAASAVAAAPSASKSVRITEEEQRYVDLVNYERSIRGLNTLRVDPLLIEVSRSHSKEMCELNYFDHKSPTPGRRTALDRYLLAVPKRPTWAYLGENLFYCSIVDINRGHTCLMESPGHRENILNPKFQRIGVGIHKDGNGEFWVTQMFLAATD